ncbi:MAG: HAMP domain-containing histidine kinase [Chloroflexota bacterium]|nr:HAMP domain-containing histidine kinase [Chloroflexota bacterium]
MPTNAPQQLSPQTRRSFLRTWRRRLLAGLRWQLTFVYSVLFSLIIILFDFFTSFIVAPALPSDSDIIMLLQVATLVLIVLGTGTIFLLTNGMLSPLRRLSDAAQAIALGDLEQSQRLEPLLQTDDEVGKIAASLNGIVEQVDRASTKQQANEGQLRRLFSDASHQLRTPLTSIRGFTEVLMRGAKDDPETMQRILKLLHKEAERMTRLVNDLLMLARLDEGGELPTQRVDLVDLAVEAVEQAKVMAPDARKISLIFVTDEHLDVQANADRLKQVLHILFDNALKYGQPAPDGWIRLHLDRQNGHALLQVKNSGKGIHPKDLPHIFERFYRGEHIPTYGETTVLPQGTGLGLSIAMAIVDAHQGHIKVQSEPDTETVFTVALPTKTS